MILHKSGHSGNADGMVGMNVDVLHIASTLHHIFQYIQASFFPHEIIIAIIGPVRATGLAGGLDYSRYNNANQLRPNQISAISEDFSRSIRSKIFCRLDFRSRKAASSRSTAITGIAVRS